MEVQINVLRDGVVVPEYHTEGAAGFDLAIPVDVTLKPNELKYVPLGFVVHTPPQHMLLVVPRSSTTRRWGVELANTVGIVDEDYSGPEDEMLLALRWTYPAVFAGNQDGYGNWTRNSQTIPAGTRLAQGIFVPVTHVQFAVTEENTKQTRGGWGSTGA